MHLQKIVVPTQYVSQRKLLSVWIIFDLRSSRSYPTFLTIGSLLQSV